MTRYRQDEDQFPTVLDCLLYQKPKADGQYDRERDPFLASIARDLEALLNSRRRGELISGQYIEASTSILNFGVPEFDQYGNLSAASEQTRLCKTMEAAIRIFEPRLSRVSVRMIAPGKADSALRFRIDATIGELGEEGVFEAGLKRGSNAISVTAGGAA
jgi:type VI secretion system lysozyme-like protein